jgi:hypothetical protein
MGLQAAAAGATALHRPRLIPARGGGWLGRQVNMMHGGWPSHRSGFRMHVTCSQACTGPTANTLYCRRRLARAPLPAAQARRGKEESSAEGLAAEWKNLEVSPALAAQTDDLVQMLPDPANPPESLLDDGFDSGKPSRLPGERGGATSRRAMHLQMSRQCRSLRLVGCMLDPAFFSHLSPAVSQVSQPLPC